jgi:hypothetical protein
LHHNIGLKKTPFFVKKWQKQQETDHSIDPRFGRIFAILARED